MAVLKSKIVSWNPIRLARLLFILLVKDRFLCFFAHCRDSRHPASLFLPLLFYSIKDKLYTHLWIIFYLPSFPKSSHWLNHMEVPSIPIHFYFIQVTTILSGYLLYSFSIIFLTLTFYTHSNPFAARFGLFQLCFTTHLSPA